MSDRDGYIEEKILDSPIDWATNYKQIQSMSLLDIEHYEKQMLTNFPNTYTYTKRMAEHMLIEQNIT
jgi:hypothetical protein